MHAEHLFANAESCVGVVDEIDPFVGDGWWFCVCPTHVQRTLDVLVITANTGLLTIAYLLKKQVREFVLGPKALPWPIRSSTIRYSENPTRDLCWV